MSPLLFCVYRFQHVPTCSYHSSSRSLYWGPRRAIPRMQSIPSDTWGRKPGARHPSLPGVKHGPKGARGCQRYVGFDTKFIQIPRNSQDETHCLVVRVGGFGWLRIYFGEPRHSVTRKNLRIRTGKCYLGLLFLLRHNAPKKTYMSGENWPEFKTLAINYTELNCFGKLDH